MALTTRTVRVVEDDGDGGCSWCPVSTEAWKENDQVSQELWAKGEELRKVKNWAEALTCFNRGIVADPRSSKCWSSISEVKKRGNVQDCSPQPRDGSFSPANQ